MMYGMSGFESHTPEALPVTPNMADDWREYIWPELSQTRAAAKDMRKLAAGVQERLDAKEVFLRGSVTGAILAMHDEGEVNFTPSNEIYRAF